MQSPNEDKESVQVEIKRVKQRIKEKEDKLRKLELVQNHKSKSEEKDLSELSGQWLVVCQQALEDLHCKLKSRNANIDFSDTEEFSLGTLIQKLGLNPELINYDESEDCFKT